MSTYLCISLPILGCTQEPPEYRWTLQLKGLDRNHLMKCGKTHCCIMQASLLEHRRPYSNNCHSGRWSYALRKSYFLNICPTREESCTSDFSVGASERDSFPYLLEGFIKIDFDCDHRIPSRPKLHTVKKSEPTKLYVRIISCPFPLAAVTKLR